MTKPPDWFMVPPMTLSPGRLGDGHRLARHHGLVDRAAPFEHLAVDGHRLARPHAQAVADCDLIELDLLVACRPA